MSLLERILQSKDHDIPCNDCVHLIFPKKNLPFCKVKDRIILPDFPPTKCGLRERGKAKRIDYIRNMTVEEMAKIIYDLEFYDEEYCKRDCGIDERIDTL